MSVKKLTRLALLTTVALIIFVIEAQIPNPIPIPGVKLGLANIVTVYAVFLYKPGEVFMILLCRILLGSMFSGNMVSLLFSLSGGMLCLAAMLVVKRFLTLKQIWACSIIGSIFHNIGQILAAVFITQSVQIALYLPALLISGILTGLFTGVIAQYLVKRTRIS